MARKIELRNTRIVCTVAHIDAGKTTTTEELLFRAGLIHKVGTVHTGTATMDYLTQEKERGITIVSAAVAFYVSPYVCDDPKELFISAGYDSYKAASKNKDKRKFKVYLTDTPGHADFFQEVNRSTRIAQCGILVMCARSGVQPQTLQVSKQLIKNKAAIIVFVNKMDNPAADFLAAVSSVNVKLGIPTVLLHLPIFVKEQFVGVVDVLRNIAHVWKSNKEERKAESSYEVEPVPDHMLEQVAEHRHKLMECSVEQCDALFDKYLSEGSKAITLFDVIHGLRLGCKQCNFALVTCGAALRHKGIEDLIDAIINYFPSPEDVSDVVGTNPDNGEKECRRASDDESTTVYVYKTQADRHGVLYHSRVYSGCVSPGMTLRNANTGNKLRIGRMVEIRANERYDITEAYSGDIVGLIGLKDVRSGDTLCDDKNPIMLETMVAEDPVIECTLEAADKNDYDRLSKVVRIFASEDPSFRICSQDREDSSGVTCRTHGQVNVAAMGELHVEVVTQRMESEYGLKVKAGAPRVSYKECITQEGRIDFLHKKQSGGRGEFARVVMTASPEDRGTGVRFVNAITCGRVPKDYIPSIEKGIFRAVKAGVRGYPLVDVVFTLVDGEFHEVDSSTFAFERAACAATHSLIEKCEPRLLEPILQMQIIVSNDHVGDVIGDINSRRGVVIAFEPQGNGETIIDARLPLAESFKYITTLRSITSGTGTYTSVFSHYDFVPQNMVETIVGKK